MSFDDFRTLLALSLRNPERTAHLLIGQNWPLQARWMALLAAVSVSAVLAWLAVAIFAPAAPEGGPGMMLNYQPMIFAAMQVGAIVLAAGLMAGVGRLFGGQGRFADALLLTVWIEVLLLLIQALQLVVALVLPVLAGLLGLAAMALFLWLTVYFTKALHGFRSTLKVVVGLVLTAIVTGFVLSLLAAAFGIMPEMAP